jgi:hypothetical protein
MALNLKLHRMADGRKLVCVTDSDLLGKVFSEGQKQLDFSTAYYKGEEKPKDAIEKHVMSSYMVTFSGKEAIKLAQEMEVIDDAHTLSIKGVPQAQVLIG